LNKMRWKQQW